VIAVAPGSVWATKRWTPGGFTDLVREIATTHDVVLIGGGGDRELCAGIATRAGAAGVANTAGELPFLASAALLGHAAALVSNDSAPVHLASAMGTPVVEIYGATGPQFGFTPWQVPHRIVQLEGLPCKPCRIHGSDACPIGTFECMEQLPARRVLEALQALLADVSG
jgi:heptosyltransferase-2